MIDVSVIVPAYNAEAYIRKCLDSLLNQTKKEIEIIAVNDGSKDKTLDILNEYKSNYPEIITVISQENQGLSTTRNNGIKVARGKYIAFVDSDDYVKEDMLEVMFNKALQGDYDVVACGVDAVYPDKVMPISIGIDFDSKKLTPAESKEIFLNMYVIVCNKIFKKELFSDEQLLFEPGIWFEDVLFFSKLVPNLKSIACVENYFYEYLQRTDSITYTYSDKLLDIHLVLNKILEYYKKNGFYEEYKAELEYMYVRYMFATFIKRLSKAKNRKKFKEGVRFAQETVRNTFPDYKKNIYLNNGSKKGLYLKHFNSLLADAVYFVEKNRMN